MYDEVHYNIDFVDFAWKIYEFYFECQNKYLDTLQFFLILNRQLIVDVFLSPHFLDICNDNIVSLCGHISTKKSHVVNLEMLVPSIFLQKENRFYIIIHITQPNFSYPKHINQKLGARKENAYYQYNSFQILKWYIIFLIRLIEYPHVVTYFFPCRVRLRYKVTPQHNQNTHLSFLHSAYALNF